MAQRIAIASQKGGVGKTTTAVNLGAYLAASGRRVLIVDLDPQGNAASSLSVRPADRGALRELWGGRPWSALARPSALPDLSVFPAAPRLASPITAEELRSPRVAELRLELERADAWETVIFDCPPSIGTLTYLALQWADQVLVPVQCEYLAMEGLTQMLELIDQASRTRSVPMEPAGILLTLFSAELQLSLDVVDEVRKYFPEQVLSTIIPRDVALAEAASHGEPIRRYSPRSRGAWAYLNLAKEILEHELAKTR